MIPFWPADLPQRVIADGYSEGFSDGRLRTPMEAGPPKVRRRFSTAVRPVSASFRVSADGKARLERFWNEELLGGSLPFLMPDQTNDSRGLATESGVQLLDEQGRPLINTSWWLVLFGEGAPSFSTRNRGISFVAAFPLSILP